jgi:co-chaperonin GroES (HSP10)
LSSAKGKAGGETAERGRPEKSKEDRLMKTAQLFGVAMLSFASLPILALQADVSAQAAGSANGSAGVVAELRPVNGELATKLDAKSAKVGDQVVVKTIESVKTASGVVIPKGSRLVGSVTEVQAHGAESADSHVGIRFDRVELKGGQTLAIQSEIRSLSLPVSAATAGSMGNDASLGPMGGGGGAMGGARGGMAGGGPAGGALGGNVSSVPNNIGRTPGTLDPTVNGTVQAGQAPGQMAGSVSDVGSRVNAGATGGVVRATGVPGVMLSGRGRDASSASGTLWASKQNVHLDSGTQIVLGVAADAH